jgi:hypothetical protein
MDDRSTVPSYGQCLFALKFRFHVEIFRLSRLGVASLLCDLIWAIRLSAASVIALYCMGSHNRDEEKMFFLVEQHLQMDTVQGILHLRS